MDDITGVFGSLGQVNTGAVLFDIILTTLASMALGVLITLFYAYMNRKKGFTLEFSVTIIAISSVIAMIIAVIGTNIASAFSLAGIMSIVRFRSLQQKTSDIAFLFVAMAAGLTAGLGLLLPALAFVVLTGVLLNLYVFLAGRVKPETRLVKICVPESMSFDGQFDEVLRKHTLSYDLKRVRLISSGTVMELAYTVNLKDLSGVSALLSDIREKNSNFNVVLMYDADDER
ncbi:MAG: DUF4956 domain-containing protein [Eubacteriales bacterium]|nr:DUF4956 domain-containing protein [Clostridiales bacterium]MDD7302584.1 DUF4956 domain-containing protein [Eubacteriales bacterium]MDY4436016.1 DUF4956 domain-containing protein [Candidatus Flemingibacterium sp.]